MSSSRRTFRPRRPSGLATLLPALFIAASRVSSLGAEFQLDTNVTVVFSSVEAGRAILTRRDNFITALTPLDRRSRMATNQDVSEVDFLAFVGRSVRPRSPEETQLLAGGLQSVRDKLAPWQLPLPATIVLVKTSGEEEFNNCYTRQNAIVFPASEAAGPPAALNYLILHELFHVLSRHDPELRKTLCGVIGFKPIREIELPEALRARKVTNPDGVQNGWRIALNEHEEALQAVPILLANGPRFNPNESGASLDDYFRLLVVNPVGTGWAPQLVAGHPRLLKPEATQGWFEQIGRNTRYTIHPDEILADNFVRLINGDTNLPTPRIIADMANAFRHRATEP